MKRRLKNHGFTMVELLVALMVASIVLAAVATLAGATVAANQATDQMGREQSHLRLVSMHLTDLIRRTNRVTSANNNKFTLWHDDNADGLETANELTRIDKQGDGLTIGTERVYNQCENICFSYDSWPPNIQFITVSFDINENGQLQNHSVNARLRVSDEHRQF